MTSLADAWNWYRATRDQLALAQRLGRKHWDRQEFRDLIGRDDHARDFNGAAVIAATSAALQPLDDLAVLVLFSVFEAIVRDRLVTQFQDERIGLIHPVLREAAREAVEGIKNGSFHNNVIEPLKADISDLVIEPVNQVRRYRNWVAHGRRTEKPESVTPEVAYERLSLFLEAITPPPLDRPA